MHIPSHQIQNVLNAYSRQLSQSRMLTGSKDAVANPSTVPAEGKRQAIIDRVATEIVKRITSFGPRHAVGHGIENGPRDEPGKPDDLKLQTKGQFVFSVIDGTNRKTTHTLSVEDSSFLIQRLEKLAKEAADRNLESEDR